MPKVLIVEDDDALAVALKDGFEYEGFAVSVVGDGAAALDLVRDGAGHRRARRHAAENERTRSLPADPRRR